MRMIEGSCLLLVLAQIFASMTFCSSSYLQFQFSILLPICHYCHLQLLLLLTLMPMLQLPSTLIDSCWHCLCLHHCCSSNQNSVWPNCPQPPNIPMFPWLHSCSIHFHHHQYVPSVTKLPLPDPATLSIVNCQFRMWENKIVCGFWNDSTCQ